MEHGKGYQTGGDADNQNNFKNHWVPSDSVGTQETPEEYRLWKVQEGLATGECQNE